MLGGGEGDECEGESDDADRRRGDVPCSQFSQWFSGRADRGVVDIQSCTIYIRRGCAWHGWVVWASDRMSTC